jgi:hypothetical protein
MYFTGKLHVENKKRMSVDAVRDKYLTFASLPNPHPLVLTVHYL